mmetsp:Transcript_19533/g.25193  ORF Transcript_19533/g.25193 Transcript_19533/m.25193 type:complete len:304 (+) Transcript_19533:131-1042(+)|eukprot:CAMPEP_0198146174 /NCGR_PEP_ID=MMETSP1443-20131203/27895_1 /TAXON_ID=186043 /ORGANISM="Entomoneis sp., Strain CCMP2396" /LENGTH=303 /DNA_ID=CAMNT_0043810035 /DNA_START=88 /DNA_END=999 /DNA_ORIENTATION=+
MLRPTKRQRMELPPSSWMDIESLERIAVAVIGVGTATAAPSLTSSSRTSSGRNSPVAATSTSTSDHAMTTATAPPTRTVNMTMHMIQPKLANAVAGEIFLDRLFKEVIYPLRFNIGAGGSSGGGGTANSLTLLPNETIGDARHRHLICKQRLTVGLNATTRVLEQHQQQQYVNAVTTTKAASLVILVATPSSAPASSTTASAIPKSQPNTAVLWQHIPVLCTQQSIPLLLLPPGLEQRLGQLVFGDAAGSGAISNSRVPGASCLVFLQRPQQPHSTTAQDIHQRFDSFVDYVTNGFMNQAQYF